MSETHPALEERTKSYMQEARKPHQKGFLSLFHDTLKNAWFYVSVVISVVSILFLLRPQVLIQSQITEDNPFATLFVISNPGYWTLSNVEMRCHIFNGNDDRGTFGNNVFKYGDGRPITGNGIIDRIERNRTATRDCGITNGGIRLPNIDPMKLRISIEISYRYAWGIIPTSFRQEYDTRIFKGHVILVQDIE